MLAISTCTKERAQGIARKWNLAGLIVFVLSLRYSEFVEGQFKEAFALPGGIALQIYTVAAIVVFIAYVKMIVLSRSQPAIDPVKREKLSHWTRWFYSTGLAVVTVLYLQVELLYPLLVFLLAAEGFLCYLMRQNNGVSEELMHRPQYIHAIGAMQCATLAFLPWFVSLNLVALTYSLVTHVIRPAI